MKDIGANYRGAGKKYVKLTVHNLCVENYGSA